MGNIKFPFTLCIQVLCVGVHRLFTSFRLWRLSRQTLQTLYRRITRFYVLIDYNIAESDAIFPHRPVFLYVENIHHTTFSSFFYRYRESIITSIENKCNLTGSCLCHYYSIIISQKFLTTLSISTTNQYTNFMWVFQQLSQIKFQFNDK